MTMPQNDAGHAGPVGLFPPTFSQDYVEGAVRPFLLSGRYVGERPTLPMIDLELSKDNATGAHLFGMFYDGWVPNPEEDGLTVFIRGYEKRGPDNMPHPTCTPPGSRPKSVASSTSSSPTPTRAGR